MQQDAVERDASQFSSAIRHCARGIQNKNGMHNPLRKPFTPFFF